MNTKTAPFWNIFLPIEYPYLVEPYMTGAASCLAILRYLNPDHQPDSPYALYDYGHPFNEAVNQGIQGLDPTAVAAILNAYKLPPYNFGVLTEGTLGELLKAVCHWMDYAVPAASRPNCPVTLPVLGSYDHWVIVNGAGTDIKPDANQHPFNIRQFTVFGLMLVDNLGAPNYIGYKVYKTAAELANYIKPLATSDKYNGKFIAVAEPPSYTPRERVITAARLRRMRLNLRAPSVDFYTRRLAALCRLQRASSRPRLFTSADIGRIIDWRVFSNPEFAGIYSQTDPAASIYVSARGGSFGDYYIIPLADRESRLVRAAVLIDARTGYFKELSWSGEGSGEYLPVDIVSAISKVIRGRGIYRWRTTRAALIYSPDIRGCSLYYPAWEIMINGRERWVVTQDGAAARL
jgi:hypothetical protein